MRQPLASSHIKPYHYTGFSAVLQEKYSFFCVFDVEILTDFSPVFRQYAQKQGKNGIFGAEKAIFEGIFLFFRSGACVIFAFFGHFGQKSGGVFGGKAQKRGCVLRGWSEKGVGRCRFWARVKGVF